MLDTATVDSNSASHEPWTFGQLAAHLRDCLDEGDFGFVASAVTPWHALGIEAWVCRLRAEGETRRGIVLLVPHSKDGSLVDCEHLPNCLADPRIEIIAIEGHLPRSPWKLLKRLLVLAFCFAQLVVAYRRRTPETTCAFRIASAQVPDFFTFLHIFRHPAFRELTLEFVLVDEGLGTYLPQYVVEQNRRADWSTAGRHTWFGRVDFVLRAIYRRVQRRICNRYTVCPRFLFGRTSENDSLSVVESIAADYRAALSVFRTGWLSGCGGGPLALLVPQPWSEYLQLSEQAERQFLEKLLGQLQSCGYKVAIKPHPREAEGKYDALARRFGCHVLPRSIPGEAVMVELQPEDILVGHNTNSLLTAAALYGHRSYTLGNALMMTVEPGEFFVAMHQRFRQLAGNLVEDIDQLCHDKAA